MWPGSKALFDRFKLSEFGCARQQKQRRIRGNLLQYFFQYMCCCGSIIKKPTCDPRAKKLTYTGKQEKFVVDVVAVTAVLVRRFLLLQVKISAVVLVPLVALRRKTKPTCNLRSRKTACACCNSVKVGLMFLVTFAIRKICLCIFIG